MSFYVFLLVTFRCDNNDGVAALAHDHLIKFNITIPDEPNKWPTRTSEEDGEYEAICFLADLSHRSGKNKGRNGGVSSWGTIGNYTDINVFINKLKPFFLDLLNDEKIDGGPNCEDHIIILTEKDQSQQAHVLEIYRPIAPLTDTILSELVIQEKKLPFYMNI